MEPCPSLGVPVYMPLQHLTANHGKQHIKPMAVHLSCQKRMAVPQKLLKELQQKLLTLSIATAVGRNTFWLMQVAYTGGHLAAQLTSLSDNAFYGSPERAASAE